MRNLVIACCGALLGLALTAGAQSYPAKPILMIVPVQAGSAADSIVRIVANKMSDNMGQQIVLENVPGASGLIGAERIARAPTDGYTIAGINDGTLDMTPHLYKKVNYEPLASFEPVSLLAAITWVLITHPSLPVKSVKEFIALARARPGQIDYSSGGNGSPQHIGMELLASRAGVQLHHIPYRGATGAALDVIGGQVPCMMSGLAVVIGNVREGKVRALGIASPKRSPLLPDVPTIAESGMPGFQYTTWGGLFVPKGTPRAIIDRLHAEAVKAVGDAKTRDSLLNIGLEPVGSSPEELGRATREAYARMGEVIRRIGLTPQ